MAIRKSTAEEYIKNAKSGVIDYNNPTCSSCRDCCSVLTMISIEEHEKLEKYFKKDKEGKAVFKIALKKFVEWQSPDTLNLMCPFSTKNLRCSIYNKRPRVCREFHCSKSLNKFTEEDRSKLANEEHKTLMDLFK